MTAPQCTAAGQSVVYVYGVTRPPAGAKVARLGGILPDATVQPLLHAGLLAFVSAVPAAQFGANEFRAALADAQWLKDRILAHEQVLEDLRASYDIVPCRFGTIYLDDLQVLNALARHRAELCEALDRVGDASEWGVKIFCDLDRLRRRIEVDSDSIRTLRDMLARASPGAGFFLQKKYAKACDDEVAAQMAGCVARSRQCLDGCARESVEVRLQPAEVHGRSADMIMNAAYLVAEGHLGRFQEIVAALEAEFSAHGFAYETTGPWPPYHFVATREESFDGVASDQ